MLNTNLKFRYNSRKAHVNTITFGLHGILEIGWIDENSTLGKGLASTRLKDFVRDILYTCCISQSPTRHVSVLQNLGALSCPFVRCLQCQLHIEVLRKWSNVYRVY